MRNNDHLRWVGALKEQGLHVAIAAKDGRRLGSLSPITLRSGSLDDATLALLCAWHNRHRDAQVDRTPWEVAATRAWLARTDGDDTRLLCWIHDVDGHRLGYCGVTQLDREGALVYDVVRGAPGGHPLLMPFADVALARLALFGAGCARLEGGILGANVAARRSSQLAGFVDTGRRWLRLDAAAQRMVPAAEGSDDAEAQHWMVLDRATFAARYPGLTSRPPLVAARSLPADRDVDPATEGDPIAAFRDEVAGNVRRLGADAKLAQTSIDWGLAAAPHRYTYNFRWLGRPIIQLPQDIVAVQELIWEVQPDLIVETGIAHGGSLILSASLLQLLGGDGLVVGVDIDVRAHNRRAIEAHPMAHRIRMVEGSSVAPETFAEVQRLAAGRRRVLVMLDSNHAHDHVLAELRLYSQLIRSGSYLVVFDTAIAVMPADAFTDRPWGPGNNPLTAVRAFLEENHRFAVDTAVADKLQITVAIDGYLRCLVDP